MSDAQSTPAGGKDRRGLGSNGNAAGHGEQSVARSTLKLKRKPIEAATVAPPAAETDKPVTTPKGVPLDAPVSYVNWRVGHARPTHRFETAEAAFAEARRLRELTGAVIYTYRVELIDEASE